MRILKSFVCILVSGALLLSGAPTLAETVNRDEKILNAIGFKGILPDKTNAITRFELAEFAISLAGISKTSEGEAVFTDIPKKHKDFEIINTAYIYGLMGESSNGRFEPNKSAVASDAACIMLYLLGYGNFMKEQAWNNVECIQKAKSLGVFKGLDISAELSRETLIKMYVNILKIPTLRIRSITSGYTDYYTDDVDYLQEEYGLYNKTGILTATDSVALPGYSTVSSGWIQIDNDKYKIGSVDYTNYLGYEVDIIVDSEEIAGNLLYLEPASKSYDDSMLEINAVDIIDYNQYELRYYKNNKVKIINLDSSCQFLLNGKEITRYDERLLKPLAGNLKLMDYNDDGTYDCVNITMKFYYSVAGCSEGVYLKDSITGYKLELEDKKITVKKDGIFADFAHIKAGQVVAVLPDAVAFDENDIAFPDNNNLTSITFEIIQNKISGTIHSLNEELCTIDENEYLYSDYFKMLVDNNYMKTPQISDNAEVYLDDGYIVYGDFVGKFNSKERDFEYGYLMAIAETTPLSNIAVVKLVNENAEIVVIETAENWRINNEKGKASDVLNNSAFFVNGEVQRQLIAYDLNEEGKITHIYTSCNRANETIYDFSGNSIPNPDYDPNYKGYTPGEFSFDCYLSDSTTYKNSFNHLYTFDENSLVFVIPRNINSKKNFRVSDGSAFQTNNSYANVSLYNVTEKYLVKVAVIDNSASGVETQRNLNYSLTQGNCNGFLITGTSQQLIDDEVKLCYTGLTYDKGGDIYERTLVATDDALVDTDALIQKEYRNTVWNTLHPGDVIHYALDESGMVERFKKIADYNDFHKTDGMNYKYLGIEDPNYTAYHTYSKVVKIFDDGQFLFNVSGTDNIADMRLSNQYVTGGYPLQVFIYYNDRGYAVKGSVNDICIDDNVYTRSESGKLVELVIYR